MFIAFSIILFQQIFICIFHRIGCTILKQPRQQGNKCVFQKCNKQQFEITVRQPTIIRIDQNTNKILNRL
ncbi:unnamed protein product (macronuclear) [Paramecium tetraurelia]|uniref:Secreted protein n=1 Tax=Paramecium tetraurelia TaxID=5888 RepID=A0CTB1_PARTE|nr:uncharacterized protein GSPATT00010262001 [Paramecium tetraurelia]CAK74028.1 unnamed protein product [Paramecium tetraurelia]|eukprot:XP_001441425.1 hypothetical protein (macronuclear) [Paramecium tetraurelia strain d4-2]